MDLFGQALSDYQSGEFGHDLTIRRDDGHVDAHSPSLYFEKQPFAHEIDLLKRARRPVLDVGCGAGRHLLWLAENEIEATGIDVSAGAVETCRRRGCAQVVQHDIMSDPDARFTSRFVTATLFGNNVGIGGSYAGARTLLERIGDAISPAGELLLTGLDVTQTTNPAHLAYHQRNLKAGRPRGEISMRFEYRGRVGPWTHWYHPEPYELEALARKTGWRVAKIDTSKGVFFSAILGKS